MPQIPLICYTGVGRRGCSGLKKDKENKIQISPQFVLRTNTYHNRFVWKRACDVKLVSPPHLSKPLLSDRPVPASRGRRSIFLRKAAALQLRILPPRTDAWEGVGACSPREKLAEMAPQDTKIQAVQGFMWGVQQHASIPTPILSSGWEWIRTAGSKGAKARERSRWMQQVASQALEVTSAGSLQWSAQLHHPALEHWGLPASYLKKFVGWERLQTS